MLERDDLVTFQLQISSHICGSSLVAQWQLSHKPEWLSCHSKVDGICHGNESSNDSNLSDKASFKAKLALYNMVVSTCMAGNLPVI